MGESGPDTAAIRRALTVPMPNTRDGDEAWETWTAARLLLVREVPALLAEVVRLREAVERVRAACDYNYPPSPFADNVIGRVRAALLPVGDTIAKETR